MTPSIQPPMNVVNKVWGREVWFANNDSYCGKLLEFNSNHAGSMHYHLLKDETFYVLSGEGTLAMIDTASGQHVVHALKIGDTVRLSAGQPHQIITDTMPLVICEVSTTHDDNDTYRITPSR